MITGVQQIRDAYRDERVARNYVDERFREPLGGEISRPERLRNDNFRVR